MAAALLERCAAEAGAESSRLRLATLRAGLADLVDVDAAALVALMRGSAESVDEEVASLLGEAASAPHGAASRGRARARGPGRSARSRRPAPAARRGAVRADRSRAPPGRRPERSSRSTAASGTAPRASGEPELAVVEPRARRARLRPSLGHAVRRAQRHAADVAGRTRDRRRTSTTSARSCMVVLAGSARVTVDGAEHRLSADQLLLHSARLRARHHGRAGRRALPLRPPPAGSAAPDRARPAHDARRAAARDRAAVRVARPRARDLRARDAAQVPGAGHHAAARPRHRPARLPRAQPRRARARRRAHARRRAPRARLAARPGAAPTCCCSRRCCGCARGSTGARCASSPARRLPPSSLHLVYIALEVREGRAAPGDRRRDWPGGGSRDGAPRRTAAHPRGARGARGRAPRCASSPTLTGLHENAVRRTLASLAARARCSSSARAPAPAAGRCCATASSARADEPFRALLPMLLDLLGERALRRRRLRRRLRATAAQPARCATARARRSSSSLVTLGFAPVERPAGGRGSTLDLTRCPFADAVTRLGATAGRSATSTTASSRASRRPPAASSRSSRSTIPASCRAASRFRERAARSARERRRLRRSRRSSAGRRTARPGASSRLTETLAVVELCTCYGTPVDELRSSDPALIRFLSARERPTD